MQTHASLRRSLLEEAYEAAEAIDREDPALLKEELGDLLLQVVFHADIERQAGDFTMDDVADGEVRKMLFRHPHVFGGQETVQDADTVLEGWEAIKRREKGQQTTAQALDAVARSLPGLWRAEKLQSKAARDGFDWPDISGALDKLDEEVSELHRAAAGDGDVTEELGDVLFAAVKVGRFVGVDPEVAIHGTCEKFIRRYRAAITEHFKKHLQAMPGAFELLTRLSIPFGVATNGPREKVLLTLEVTGLLPLVGDRIFSAYEYGRFKPDPELFLIAAKALGQEPRHCAVVEDSIPGVIAGVAAGMPVGALLGRDGMPDQGADRVHCIDSLADLESCL